MIPPPVCQERMQKQCQTLPVSDTAGYDEGKIPPCTERIEQVAG